jgi:post-segregation antitoxin (ccd killing protein)
MRDPLFEPKAAKQTVSVTLNSDLYAKAKSAGINTSKVAEEALAYAYAQRRSEALTAEFRQDLAAVDNYAEEHGSFADLVREHYEREDNERRDDERRDDERGDNERENGSV